jgi:hypothetical protein
MNEDALRALVRETILRVQARGEEAPRLLDMVPATAHPSNYQYALPPSDGPCIIEPGVACNHCGYCQVHGY